MSGKTKPPRAAASRARRSKKSHPKRFAVDPLQQRREDLMSSERTRAAVAPDVVEQPPPGSRIEFVGLNDLRPDPWQSRKIVPPPIRSRYLAYEITGIEAVAEWKTLAESDPLAAQAYGRLRTLAVSLLGQDQINATAVVPRYSAQGPYWEIQAGERRYLAKCLSVAEGLTQDATLKVVIWPEPDVWRQAVENLQTERLTAVGQARQVAKLYLESIGLHPGSEKVPPAARLPGSSEYYRLALRPVGELLDGRTRLQRGTWEKIEAVFGHSRQHLERHLNALRLPDDVLDLADQFQLNERQLRALLALSPERQHYLIRPIGELGLTSAHIEYLGSASDLDAALKEVREQAQRELEASETDNAPAPTAPSKKRRKTPVKHPPAKVLADRISGIATVIKGVPDMDTTQAIEHLADQLVAHADYSRALESLEFLEQLVARLRVRLAARPPS